MTQKQKEKWNALYELTHQHPTGISTMGMCLKQCGNPARGGAVCPACIGKELRRLKVSEADVEAVMNANKLLQLARMELDEIQERIMK